MKVKVVSGHDAYDSKMARAAVAKCGTHLIPPVEDAVHWAASQAGAPQRNAAIHHIAQSGKQD